MEWLVAGPSFAKLLAVLLLFSSYFGLYNGAMIPLLAELMPAPLRTSGFLASVQPRHRGFRRFHAARFYLPDPDDRQQCLAGAVADIRGSPQPRGRDRVPTANACLDRRRYLV